MLGILLLLIKLALIPDAILISEYYRVNPATEKATAYERGEVYVLNPEVLTRIDAADDLKIAPYHPDMNTTGTPTWIWEVKVDNRLFVRAYSGIRSKWYQAALSQQAGKILAIGQEFDVLFAKPSDPELESKIDQAYLKKYSGSSYVSAMTGIRARAATIEILPS